LQLLGCWFGLLLDCQLIRQVGSGSSSGFAGFLSRLDRRSCESEKVSAAPVTAPWSTNNIV
jgi:hypothetical protein